MGYWKNLQIFCLEYNKNRTSNFLDPRSRLAHDLYNADRKGLSWQVSEVPEIVDDRDLTWDEVEQLTGGMPGPHHTPCPYCAPEKELSSRFKIERTLTKSSWYCFYCGARGTVETQTMMSPTPTF